MPTFAAQLVELRSKFEAEMQAVIDDARKREASLEQTIADLERLAAQQDQRMAHKPVDKVESFKKQLQKQRLLRDVDAEYMRVNSNDRMAIISVCDMYVDTSGVYGSIEV